jgi:hypothetical protein
MIAAVAFGLAYLTITRVLSWPALRARSDAAKEVEILVLRHEVISVHPQAALSPVPEQRSGQCDESGSAT